MSGSAPNPTASDLTGLQLKSLSFSSDDWKHKGKWTGTARLRRPGDHAYGTSATELTLELGPEIADEIIKLLAPIVSAAAGREAQKLADQAKALADALGHKMLQLGDDQVPPDLDHPGPTGG